MSNQGWVFRPCIVSNWSFGRHGSGLLGVLYHVEFSPDRAHGGGEAVTPVLGKDLPDLRFDWTDAAFIHSIPINEVTNLAAVTLGNSNTTGVAVELPGRANERHLRPFEPTGGDFELVVKFRLVVIQPAFWRLARQQVRHGFHPGSIIERGVSKPQGKRFECGFSHGNGELSRTIGDDASSHGSFRRNIEGSTDRIQEAFDELRVSRPNFV
jgi:hypothetical protein